MPLFFLSPIFSCSPWPCHWHTYQEVRKVGTFWFHLLMTQTPISPDGLFQNTLGRFFPWLYLMKFHLLLKHWRPEEGDKGASANPLSQNAEWKGALCHLLPSLGASMPMFSPSMPHDSCIMERKGCTHTSPPWEWPTSWVTESCSSSPPTLNESKKCINK